MKNKPIQNFFSRCANDIGIFSDLLEVKNYGIWIADKNGTAIFANSACCKLFGITNDDFVGQYNIFEDSLLAEQGVLPIIKNAFTKGNTAKTVVSYSLPHLLNGDSVNVSSMIIEFSLTPIMNKDGTIENMIFHLNRVFDEEQLIETKEKYQLLYKNIPIPYQSLNEEGCIVDINPAWAKTLDYTKEEVAGKWFGDFLHPDNLRDFSISFADFKKKGSVNGIEFKLRHKDGHFIDALFNGSVGYKADGRFGQTYCVFQDVTVNRELQTKLELIKERYRSIVHNTSSCIVVFSVSDDCEDFIIEYLNPEAEKVEQVRKELIIGKKLTEVFPGVVDFGLFDLLKQVWESGDPAFLPSSFYKDDRISGYRESYVYKLSSGELVSVYQDLTEYKLAKKQLDESEHKFRIMADFTSDWEYWLDSEGNYNYLSPSCEKITGYSQEVFYNDPGFINKIVHPEDYEKVKCHYEGQDENDRKIHEMEFRIINKDGEDVWIGHKCIPIFGSNGEFLGRRGNNRDITKRKFAVKNLEKSEKEFRLMVENTVNGFAYHQIITDTEGNPVDYEFVMINKVFEEMTGISKEKALGKRVSEVIPDINDDVTDWIKIYGEVALTGKETRLESFSEALERWFSIKVYSPTKGYFATIFEDITDRKIAEYEEKNYKQKLEELVKERTLELEEKIDELDQAVKVFVGREIVIVRLKEEIDELKAKIDTV